MKKSKPMRQINWRAKVSYIGKDFCGWQIQPIERTVAGEIAKVLAKMCGHPIEIHAAGRTDAGVHAHGQVISFKMKSRITKFGLVSAMGSLLPKDISMYDVQEMPDTFHARHHNIGKKYQYRILNSLATDPFRKEVTWHRKQKINLQIMQNAAKCLVGEHDFESFRATSCQALHARRLIWKAEVSRQEDEFVFDIRGNAFCQNMIRIIVGTLYDIGRGQLKESAMHDILAAKDRRCAGVTAPAHGLSFFKVYYPDDMEDAEVPEGAIFPRYPITKETWPF